VGDVALARPAAVALVEARRAVLEQLPAELRRVCGEDDRSWVEALEHEARQVEENRRRGHDLAAREVETR
jgi:thiamine pyrophosphate-dependent acetolactate synthase large subunit-like protein